MEKRSYNEHILRNMRFQTERGACPRRDESGEGACSGYTHEGITQPPVYDLKYYIDRCDTECNREYGGNVFVANVGKDAYKNNDFRRVFWTGEHLQMTLMSLGCGEDIGIECHGDTDQYIRIERGRALLVIGQAKESMTERKYLYEGDSVFIPAGIWHNVANRGRVTLKLSSIYAPPHHPQ